jgi:hypothetical protein
MRLCNTCGNEIGDDVSICPFCKGRQEGSASTQKRPTQPLVTVNLKSGLPSAGDAVRQLDIKLAAARSKGARIVRIIHGWGSAGSGGAIKDATHEHLRRLQRQEHIRRFIAGDEYSQLTAEGRDLLRACPVLKSSLRSDRLNPGITFVEL